MPRKDQSNEPQSFEKSLQELEDIVNRMESDQLPLEELIAQYERGASLLSQCESTLESAKKRLETIAKGEKPAAAKSPSTPSSSDDDEIRLF
ncbi:exodeoxyribonuclease 7 small subunit [Rubritalea halochordaticola]|uniref:Exodeoxyribonuclease 7 small subunit n=1 Tax=Rubritalea halochordaticola TaxID=714537 RepID=A0ABP9UV66_9BACT